MTIQVCFSPNHSCRKLTTVNLTALSHITYPHIAFWKKKSLWRNLNAVKCVCFFFGRVDVKIQVYRLNFQLSFSLLGETWCWVVYQPVTVFLPVCFQGRCSWENSVQNSWPPFYLCDKRENRNKLTPLNAPNTTYFCRATRYRQKLLENLGRFPAAD